MGKHSRPKTFSKSDGGQLSIIYRKIDELKLDAENPRNHSPKQLRQLGRAITEFGFNNPVLVDLDGKVLCGHGRIAACQQLGWKTVPTISIGHLTPMQKRAFMIADNKLQENSQWNKELLTQNLKFLSDADLNFDLGITGFEDGEIDFYLNEAIPKEEGKEDPADELPMLNHKHDVSRLGDLWILGGHRIYCGNSLLPESYKELMNGKLAQIVFTDPPYNVPIKGHVSTRGTKHHEFAMAAGEMSAADFVNFLSSSIERMVQNSTKGSIHFISMDWGHANELQHLPLQFILS